MQGIPEQWAGKWLELQSRERHREKMGVVRHEGAAEKILATLEKALSPEPGIFEECRLFDSGIISIAASSALFVIYALKFLARHRP